VYLSITVDVDDPFFGGGWWDEGSLEFLLCFCLLQGFHASQCFSNFKAVKMNASNMDMSLRSFLSLNGTHL